MCQPPFRAAGGPARRVPYASGTENGPGSSASMLGYPEAGIRLQSACILFWLVLFGLIRALLDDLWIESGVWRAWRLPLVEGLRLRRWNADCPRISVLFCGGGDEEEKVCPGALATLRGGGLSQPGKNCSGGGWNRSSDATPRNFGLSLRANHPPASRCACSRNCRRGGWGKAARAAEKPTKLPAAKWLVFTRTRDRQVSHRMRLRRRVVALARRAGGLDHLAVAWRR